MKQKAVVIEANGDKATVSVLREEACAHCAGRVVCGTAKPMSTEVENPINASVGDTVIIETGDYPALLYLALIFIAPIVLCLIMVAIFMNINDVLTIVMGGVGFVLPFIVVAELGKKEGIIPKIYITKILSKVEETPPCDNEESGS